MRKSAMKKKALKVQAKDYRTLTTAQRRAVRLEYVAAQENRCYHCGCLLTEEPAEEVRNLPINWNLFPEHFLRYPVHLHHNHDTGMTIGAVHSYCNAVLWQYHGE